MAESHPDGAQSSRPLASSITPAGSLDSQKASSEIADALPTSVGIERPMDHSEGRVRGSDACGISASPSLGDDLKQQHGENQHLQSRANQEIRQRARELHQVCEPRLPETLEVARATTRVGAPRPSCATTTDHLSRNHSHHGRPVDAHSHGGRGAGPATLARRVPHWQQLVGKLRSVLTIVHVLCHASMSLQSSPMSLSDAECYMTSTSVECPHETFVAYVDIVQDTQPW
eukprot:2067240-Amphidinium_carterae.2